MKQSRATIVVKNPEALRAAAASARISTQQGTAMEIFGKSAGNEKDLSLLNKVLSSGHKSVIEHQTFTIAFNDVSVLAEQFVIECRLASFTVKSRRYVDFSGAGWVRPEGLGEAQAKQYDAIMAARFEDYGRLLELGVPREDARFLLPYCLRSNFFMTLNARELIALVCAMLHGRGKGYPEIESLGRQIKEQFDAIYPGVIDGEAERYPRYTPMGLNHSLQPCVPGKGHAELVDAPKDARALIDMACDFSGREMDLRALLTDARPRELELARYTFRIRGASLACVTHFTRHRVVSLLVPPVINALAGGRYVLPETVRAVPKAEAIYRRAFDTQRKTARAMGLPAQTLAYFALSGHQTDLLLSMNLRELVHFFKLRTCRRAQWEIREIAWEMLGVLSEAEPEVFKYLGPSCVYGRCPEGKMSCQKPYPSIWEE